MVQRIQYLCGQRTTYKKDTLCTVHSWRHCCKWGNKWSLLQWFLRHWRINGWNAQKITSLLHLPGILFALSAFNCRLQNQTFTSFLPRSCILFLHFHTKARCASNAWSQWNRCVSITLLIKKCVFNWKDG